MPIFEKGKIKRAKGGSRNTVYFSDRFGVWEQGRILHISLIIEKSEQDLHTSVSPTDGAVYHMFKVLYEAGKSQA